MVTQTHLDYCEGDVAHLPCIQRIHRPLFARCLSPVPARKSRALGYPAAAWITSASGDWPLMQPTVRLLAASGGGQPIAPAANRPCVKSSTILTLGAAHLDGAPTAQAHGGMGAVLRAEAGHRQERHGGAAGQSVMDSGTASRSRARAVPINGLPVLLLAQ